MTIKWDEINSVNVAELNSQHKKLVEIINNFFAADPNKKEELQKIVQELIDYANYHLSVEEKYFAEFAYERAEEHIRQHNGYRQKVLDFQKNIEENGGQEIFTEMSKFLREWWIFHINHSDIEYSVFFNQHGLY